MHNLSNKVVINQIIVADYNDLDLLDRRSSRVSAKAVEVSDWDLKVT